MAIQERDFERVMNQARIHLPGASDAGIKGVMFDVLDEFFDISNSWLEWVDLTLTVGNSVYQIFPQEGGMFNRLITAFDVNQVVQPVTLAFGDQSTMPPGVILTFSNPVNTATAVDVLLSKKIILPNNKDDVPNAPAWLFPLYARYILEGIVGNMMMQKAKSYSDPNAAAYHLKRFRDGMDMAKTATLRSGLFGAQAWRFPRQFRTTSQRGGVSTPFPTPTGQGVF